MSATQKNNKTVIVYLLFGSNIEPEKHILKALKLLSSKLRIANTSSIYESQSLTKKYENFLNCVVKAETFLSISEIKTSVILDIEKDLARVRTDDKNAPRTIDIDILIYDNVQLDFETCDRVYIAVPLAEIHPAFICAETGESIMDAAERLQRQNFIQLRTDLKT